MDRRLLVLGLVALAALVLFSGSVQYPVGEHYTQLCHLRIPVDTNEITPDGGYVTGYLYLFPDRNVGVFAIHSSSRYGEVFDKTVVFQTDTGYVFIGGDRNFFCSYPLIDVRGRAVACYDPYSDKLYVYDSERDPYDGMEYGSFLSRFRDYLRTVDPDYASHMTYENIGHVFEFIPPSTVRIPMIGFWYEQAEGQTEYSVHNCVAQYSMYSEVFFCRHDGLSTVLPEGRDPVAELQWTGAYLPDKGLGGVFAIPNAQDGASPASVFWYFYDGNQAYHGARDINPPFDVDYPAFFILPGNTVYLAVGPGYLTGTHPVYDIFTGEQVFVVNDEDFNEPSRIFYGIDYAESRRDLPDDWWYGIYVFEGNTYVQRLAYLPGQDLNLAFPSARKVFGLPVIVVSDYYYPRFAGYAHREQFLDGNLDIYVFADANYSITLPDLSVYLAEFEGPVGWEPVVYGGCVSFEEGEGGGEQETPPAGGAATVSGPSVPEQNVSAPSPAQPPVQPAAPTPTFPVPSWLVILVLLAVAYFVFFRRR